MSGNPHISSLVAKIENCTTEAEAISALGTSYQQDGNQLKWICPASTNHFVFATVENGKITSTGMQ
ncbi:hypothetical protein H4R24_003134 [Coemansia sp. RSA 988]|nr:hypothetical protein H4R24_003134 [Coemansia sp. RSA 988]